MSDLIQLEQLPARMRMLAEELAAVGAAVRYFGGLGPFGEWGDLLQTQTAPMCREVASMLERIQGGRA